MSKSVNIRPTLENVICMKLFFLQNIRKAVIQLDKKPIREMEGEGEEPNMHFNYSN